MGEAAGGAEAILQVKRLEPDVVLLDLVMPDVQGLEVTRKIKQYNPGTRVLLLTSFSEDDRIIAAIQAGAEGFLLKDCSPDELTHAIRTVHVGHFSLPAETACKVFLTSGPDEDTRRNQLTNRELEILGFLARDLPNQEIASCLQITPFTVRSHVRNLMKKLGNSNRAMLFLRQSVA